MPRLDLDRIESRVLHELYQVFRTTRAKLVDELVSGVPAGKAPSDFDRYIVAAKAEAIEREMAVLADEALRRIDNELGNIAQVGVRDFNNLSRAASLKVGVVGVDTATLAMVREITANRIVRVADRLKADVRLHITRAVGGGLSLTELQREIQKTLTGERTAREVETIVRTELGQAYSQAQAAANEQLVERGIDSDLIKVWRTTRDGREREEHADIDGQERELWDLFNMGDHLLGLKVVATDGPSGKGWRINGPQDPSLPAHLSINCRCDFELRPREEARMPYIAKDPAKAAERRRKALQEVSQT